MDPAVVSTCSTMAGTGITINIDVDVMLTQPIQEIQ